MPFAVGSHGTGIDGRISPRIVGLGVAGERLMRDQQLAKEPLCRLCKEQGIVRYATQVDHVIPRAQGGTDDESNLQSLCGPHHSAKSRAERAGLPTPAGEVKPVRPGGLA